MNYKRLPGLDDVNDRDFELWIIKSVNFVLRLFKRRQMSHFPRSQGEMARPPNATNVVSIPSEVILNTVPAPPGPPYWVVP